MTNLDDIGPSSETLSISSYAEITYGKVGVLITNPNSPRDGRVYLFCHMENDKDRQELNGGSGTPISTFYNTKWGKYPNTPANFITVKAGDAIGLTGGGPVEQNIENDTFKRLYPVHLHVEVYEYFETVEGADVASSPSTGWQRVDPLSVFLGKAKYETLVKLNEVKITSGAKEILRVMRSPSTFLLRIRRSLQLKRRMLHSRNGRYGNEKKKRCCHGNKEESNPAFSPINLIVVSPSVAEVNALEFPLHILKEYPIGRSSYAPILFYKGKFLFLGALATDFPKDSIFLFGLDPESGKLKSL